jgi:hypothetical protein
MHMMLSTWTASGIMADFLWTTLREKKPRTTKYINSNLFSNKAVVTLTKLIIGYKT